MAARKPVIGAVLAIALAYGIYPYVTLLRLGLAIRHGDAETLESIVDWPAVREGIKEDICDEAIEPPAARNGSQLPPFGAGFMRGVAGNAVDERVTPEALVAVGQQEESAPVRPSAALSVRWAFFASPTSFVVDLSAPGRHPPLRLQMELRGGTWQVTRVWLPPPMLLEANART